MLKRKHNALMADINNGLKNGHFVLGAGVGAMNRFARNARSKLAFPVIPNIQTILPDPVQTLSFSPSFSFPPQTPHPFKIKYNCYTHTGEPFQFGASENTQLLLHAINESRMFLESIIEATPRRRPCKSGYDIVIDLILYTEAWPYGSTVLGGAEIDSAQWNDTEVPSFPTYSRIVFNLNHIDFITTGNEPVLATLNGASVWSVMPVLIHETLHCLGIAASFSNNNHGWNRLLDETGTWYVGLNGNPETSKAIAEYRLSFGDQYHRIPVENSLGPGSALSHFEEGIDDAFQLENREFDYGEGPVVHPPLMLDIISTLAGPGPEYIFSSITAGALADLGYAVNMNNPLLFYYSLT